MFFFSSRRRHTRCLSDWSSDVCSSDLGQFPDDTGGLAAAPLPEPIVIETDPLSDKGRGEPDGAVADGFRASRQRRSGQIGRASCRERVKIWTDALSVTNRENETNRLKK